VANDRIEKRLFRVDQDVFDRPESKCSFLECDCCVRVDTAGIDTGGDHVTVVVLF
jgi:hypothetical protein